MLEMFLICIGLSTCGKNLHSEKFVLAYILQRCDLQGFTESIHWSDLGRCVPKKKAKCHEGNEEEWYLDLAEPPAVSNI